MPRVIKLPGINITLTLNDSDAPSGGIVQTDLGFDPDSNRPYDVAVSTLADTILACACTGVDVTAPSFVEAIRTVIVTINEDHGDKDKSPIDVVS